MDKKSVKQKSIVYNSIFNVIYQLLNVIFPFITSMYVSHVLEADGVGKVAYAQNIVSYFTTLAPLGVISYGVKEIAKTRGNQEQRNKCFSELFLINIFSTTAFVLMYYSIISQMEIFSSEKNLYYICGSLIILNYINVDWFYQGIEEYGYITLRSSIIKVIALITLVTFVKNKNDYILYALISNLAIGGNYIFNIIHIRKFVRLQWENIQLKRHIKPELILAFNILLSNIYSKVDITMLGVLKSEAVVGYYSNAFKIVNMILCACLAITDVLLPRLSYSYQNNKKMYSNMINTGLEIICFIIIPTTIGLNLIAEVMIPLLFGDTFRPAILTVMVLSPLILIKGFGNLACYQVAISSGNEKKQTIAYSIGGILNIILNIILIPQFCQNGAAIASVVSELSLNLIILVLLKDIVDIRISLKYIKSIIISSLIMGIVVEIILILTTHTIISCIFAVVAGMITYIITGYIMKNKIILYAFTKIIKNDN